MQTKGEQIKDGTIAAVKLVAAFAATLLRNDGSIAWTGAQNANGQRLTNLPAPTVDTDAARLADVYAMPWKDKCVVATTANITLTGTQTIDGIAVTAGMRVLVRAQTAGQDNGIYICAAGAWARSGDADTATELRGAVVNIEQGTTLADKRYALVTDTVTLGTTPLVWVDIGSGGPAYDTTSNKFMACSLTTADFQVACATSIAATPSGDAYVRVLVNGIAQVLGDGVKTRDCYFSADAGATAKTIANIAAGDVCYWVGSVAGFQLATTDIMEFEYGV